MKIILSLAILLSVRVSFAQFTDNFSDGNFTQNPAWSGEASKFVVTSGLLKLLAPAVSETAFLYTPSKAIHQATWEFFLQMDFNPSSTNFVRVYLVSDQADLNGKLNGYFVKAGNTSDEISLYRQDGTSETEIIDGLDGKTNLATVPVRIKVTRDASGTWELFSDVGPTGTYATEGSATDNTYTSSAYFGVHCTYTSTRSDKFLFDNFNVAGTIVPDTSPPVIKSITVVNDHELILLFSESLAQSSAENPVNYSVEKRTLSSAQLLPDQRTVRLTLNEPLTNGVNVTLKVIGVADLAGNAMSETSATILYFLAVPAKHKDVIFTEIFPDPSPQIGLPNGEFVEILNNSGNPFNLGGWKLSDGSSTGIFPSQIILPGEYWIVSPANVASMFSGSGKTIGLTNFPTLNNSGDHLTLSDAHNQVIDSVAYDLTWYKDDDKEEGGWTLELIDPANPCGEGDNWTASEDPRGGTPGRRNSVFANKPDLTPPVLSTVFPQTTSSVLLTFNEKLDPASVRETKPSLTPFADVSDVAFESQDFTIVKLSLSPGLKIRQQYFLKVSDWKDCMGNRMEPVTVDFGVPEDSDSLDVVINEILFDPRPGGVDFVEIYNASDKYLNAGKWKIGNFQDQTPKNVSALFSQPILFRPHDIIAFTSDPDVVRHQYPQYGPLILKAPMPSLPDDEGTIVILNDKGQLLDKLAYSKEWQSEFIKDEEGVSLERISSAGPTSDPQNWTSASSVAGFATPGLVNSQHRAEEANEKNEVEVNPEIFSTEMGTSAFTQIQYRFHSGGWIANVKILDQMGHLIKMIANNESVGTEGFFRWDGDRDDQARARMGYYLVWFEVFNSDGEVRTFRKRVVISSR